MSKRIALISLVFLSFIAAEPGFGRETKTEKRQHAKNLQALIYNIDTKILDGKNGFSKDYLESLKAGFKQVSVKLINKRRVLDVLSSIDGFKTVRDLRGFRQFLEEKFYVRMSPSKTLDKKKGRKIYLEHCASCHGNSGKGDGIFAKRLNPLPTNFLSKTFSNNVSPHMVFNFSLYGLPSGIMKPMGEVLDYYDLWCLSFYVSGMSYENVKPLKMSSLPPLNELTSKDMIQHESEGTVKSEGEKAYLRTILPYTKELKRRVP